MAVRFDGQVFTFSQPDGTPIQVRGWGDQYYAVFETLDGYTVAKNPATGYWEVARLSPDGDALEPAAGAWPRLDGARAGVPKGLRVRRESAMAAARESALRASGRRCEQRRRERRIVIDAFSKFIYRKTIDAILEGTASELNEDGLWNRGA